MFERVYLAVVDSKVRKRFDKPVVCRAAAVESSLGVHLPEKPATGGQSEEEDRKERRFAECHFVSDPLVRIDDALGPIRNLLIRRVGQLFAMKARARPKLLVWIGWLWLFRVLVSSQQSIPMSLQTTVLKGQLSRG